MPASPKVIEKVKSFTKSAAFIYPLIVIISIPLLLALNTFWNLRSFNRDVNFVIRHQAVSVADTLKPFISENLSDTEGLKLLLHTTVQSNSDIISTTILKQTGNKFEIIAATDSEEAEEAVGLGLNQLALGFNQPFAGLTYDTKLGKNVWNVVVPLETDETETHLLAIKLKTESVNEILNRTSRDSIIILLILIAVTLVLLANHFIFYRKAQKAKQLAELDKLKDEFISMAAHDLRAPITALTGYLELLRTKIAPLKKADIEDDLNTLESLTKDLHKLIDDLLEVSRIEQGRLKIEIKETQVNDVVDQVIKAVTPTATQKGLKINFSKAELPIIQTDPRRVQQIVTNLVSNAVKYTLQGEINISTKMKDKAIEVKVKDSGIGIPAEELKNLFTKFHRVKDKQTREVRGTGLGLWITKQFVERLGGRISAESIYGTGTSINFTLPLKSVN